MKSLSLMWRTELRKLILKFINDVGIEYERNRLIEYSRVKRTQADIIKFATQMVIDKVLELEEE